MSSWELVQRRGCAALGVPGWQILDRRRIRLCQLYVLYWLCIHDHRRKVVCGRCGGVQHVLAWVFLHRRISPAGAVCTWAYERCGSVCLCSLHVRTGVCKRGSWRYVL